MEVFTFLPLLSTGHLMLFHVYSEVCARSCLNAVLFVFSVFVLSHCQIFAVIFLKICYDALTKGLLVFFFDPQKILYPFSLSFSRYCTRSCLTIMAGVGVVHKLLKKQQENDNNTNL